MGGNTFASGTKRMDREQYNKTVKMAIEEFRKFSFVDIDIPYSLPSKESFGDVDVLVSVITSRHRTDETVMRLFQEDFAKYLLSHGLEFISVPGRVSVKMKGYQVDYLFYLDTAFIFASNYHRYGGVGGLLGPIARSQGLKLKDTGLYLSFEGRDLLLTQVWRIALDVLGFNPEDLRKYAEGFNIEEDMFEWITRSEYFVPSIYLPENLNSHSRRRATKRQIYQNLLSFIKARGYYPDLCLPSARSNAIASNLGRVKDLMIGLKKQALWSSFCKSKFNATLVSSITGLTGTKLGGVMQELRQSTHLDPLLLEGSEKDLADWIKEECDLKEV